jgi:hypothetical protein
MAAHQARQDEFLTRLESSEVRHLYSVKGIEDSLSGTSTGSRPLWDYWRASSDILMKQFDNIFKWLEQYRNFKIGLREAGVCGNEIVIGHDVVLVEFSRAWSIESADTIQGLEIVGADAAVQFTKQFSSYWADKKTIPDKSEVIQQLQRLRNKLYKEITT